MIVLMGKDCVLNSKIDVYPFHIIYLKLEAVAQNLLLVNGSFMTISSQIFAIYNTKQLMQDMF